MKRPWLSVLMPTYDAGAYLATALDSVVAQGDRDVEVIAIDDGSADATAAILESYAGRLPLRVLRRPRTGQWAANANEALSLARGEFVCLLHQDDVWLPGRLEVVRRLVGGWSGAVMLLHPSWYVDAKGRRLGLWPCPLPPGRMLPPELVVERLLVQNFIAAPAPVFRRGAALRVGGLDPLLWYPTDWDLWLKLAATGPTVYCPRPLTAFRIHAASQSVARSNRVEEVRRELRAVLDRHLEVWDGLPAANAEVRRAAVFSVEVNAHLLAWYHGSRPGGLGLVWELLTLGPAVRHRYFRDSGVGRRVLARLRANLKTVQGHLG